MVHLSSAILRNTFSSSELQQAPKAPGAAGTSEIPPAPRPGAAAPQVALLGTRNWQHSWLQAPPPGRLPYLHTGIRERDPGCSHGGWEFNFYQTAALQSATGMLHLQKWYGLDEFTQLFKMMKVMHPHLEASHNSRVTPSIIFS